MLKKAQMTGHQTVASKSAIKQMRASLIRFSKFPQHQIQVLFPKKAKVVTYKMRAGQDHKAEHVVVDKESHFIWINQYCVPTLRTVHAYPDMYPRFTADTGALPFVFKGANLMCPGLLNQQGSMDEVEEGAIVAIYIHGHEHCLAIGIAKMSTGKIREVKQGIAVETIHFVGDWFWNMLYK